MKNLNLLTIIVMFAVVLGLGYAALNFFLVKKLKEGNERMQHIAAKIREGANAFIFYEYKIVAIIGLIVAVVLALFIAWQAGIAFIIGAVMSATAGFVGMKIATYANVRVANAANETRNIGKTLKVAFRGGSVMGLCVAGCALLGAIIVYCIFGWAGGMLETEIGLKGLQVIEKVNPITKQSYNISIILSGYALGWSIIALFNRVGGGIYTKAADMGADLVGKTEAHIPEDDPRNPATIADNVGDNVGDVAGLGADLLESYIGAIMATIILGIELFTHNLAFNSPALLQKMILFPLLFAGIGLIGCVLGISYPLIKPKLSNDPHRELNLATWISAGVTLIGGVVLSIFLFRGEDQLQIAGFQAGPITPWIGAAIGIIAGIIIGIISEYYTSDKYKPTKTIAQASKEGSALTVTQGMATGMISTMLPVVILGVAIFACFAVGGLYGVGCGAMGMLSFVAATVSVDTYGPISDNAGGIAEMSHLDEAVREITDELDSVGNTTAAIGKGFAIGSAALATMSMMSGYLYAAGESFLQQGADLLLNIIRGDIIVGAMVGAAIPFLFSGMLINAVAKAARRMVDEVRRQFKENPKILTGEEDPDSTKCITISSQGALKQMVVPSIVAIAIPVVCGFVFGPGFVGGLLIGATLSAIMLAIYTGNAGGAWDNAKKYIEKGGVEGAKKGDETHAAAVVGDTVGDPLKDTVGPSLDILIKIMSTLSLVCVVVFSKWNLLEITGLGAKIFPGW